MKLKAMFSKSFLAIGGAIGLVVSLMFLLPYFLDRASVKAEATALLSEWAGGHIEIMGPIRLRYFPSVTFQASKVRLRDLKHFQNLSELSTAHLKAKLNWLPLLMGRIEIGELILTKPHITTWSRKVADQPSTERLLAQTPSALKFLGKTSIHRLTINDGTVLLEWQDRLNEEITKLNGDISFKEEHLEKAHGSFVWHAQKIDFDIQVPTPAAPANSVKTPLDLTVSTALFKAAMTGHLSFAEGVQLAGNLDLKINQLRDFSKWLGAPLPEGEGLKEFQANGVFSWEGYKMAFEQGRFILDGNHADGVLSLNYEKDPPLLEATLAFQDLDLNKYFENDIKSSKAKMPDENKNWSLDSDLFHFIDVDLRLSTSQAHFMGFDTQRCAFTLSLRKGQLLIDVAELELHGGHGLGHISVTAGKALTKIAVTVDLTDIEMKGFLQSLAFPAALGGAATLHLEYSAEGPTETKLLGRKFLEKGVGKFKLDMEKGGQAQLNLTNLMRDVATQTVKGWPTSSKSVTPFKQLTASLEIKKGQARTRNFHIITAGRAVSGQGHLNLTEQLIDWQLIVTDGKASQPSTNRQGVGQQNLKLSIEGPWSQPTITMKNKVRVNSTDSPAQFSRKILDRPQEKNVR